MEEMWRSLTPQVLGVLVRRYGNFEGAEDAVQDALLAAARQWPEDGVPDDPRSWLVTVASRRLIDRYRSDRARPRREIADAEMTDAEMSGSEMFGSETAGSDDESLVLLLLCCHPSLTPPSQIALTLRAIGGLTTAQIARAFLVPESSMAQRISRAKQRIREVGAQFSLPPEDERADRMRSVLHVLYLIFNEGYTASSGSDLHRVDLTREAIRVTRSVRLHAPHDGEVAGLLALMLLTDARRPARTRADGSLVPLGQQDRSRWDRASIEEGVELITATLSTAPLGPYQLQAAIAAVHAEAGAAEDTDWPQILVLYEILGRLAAGPMVSLNHAVAAAMVHGAQAGLELIEHLESDKRLSRHHRLHAVRAHLLEQAGDHAQARESYRLAAHLTTSIPEQRYLQSRADRLSE